MAAGAEQILHLLGQNGAVRNLHRAAVIDLADGGMPGDDVIVLFGKGKVVGRHDVLALQTAGAAVAQLGRDIIEIGVAEGLGDRLAQVVDDFTDSVPGSDLGLGLIRHGGAIHVGVPVVDPAHVVLVGGQGEAAKARDFGKRGAQGGQCLGPGAFPGLELIPVDACHTPDQGGVGGAGLAVGKSGIGRAGLAENIAVAGGVDDHLGHHDLAAFLGLEGHALDGASFHDGAAAPGVVHDADGIFVLQEHLIHLDLELVGLKVYSAHEAGWLGPLKAAAADAVVDGLPGVHHHGIGGADVVKRRSPHRAGDLLEAGKPLLLQAAYKAPVVPGEVRYHDHIAAGHVTAGVAVALHQDDVLAAGSCRSNSGGVPGCAGPNHQHVAAVVDFQLSRSFGIGILHRFRSFPQSAQRQRFFINSSSSGRVSRFSSSASARWIF